MALSAAGICYLGGLAIAALLCFVCAIACGTTWLVAVVLHCNWTGKLEAIRNGEYFTHWYLTDEEWREFLEAERRRTRLVLFLLPPLMSLGMLGFSCGMYESSNLIGGSVVLTFLVPPLAACAVLSAGAGYIGFEIHRNHRRRQQLRGECYIGFDGVYITGAYLPWASVGFRLVNARIEPREDGRGTLVLTFRCQGHQQTVDNDTRIPFPASHREQVEDFVSRIADNLD